MNENVINNFKSESRWFRLVFMIIYALVAYLAAFLIILLALIQAIHGFIWGEPNDRLLAFSDGVNQYIYQIIQFLTYNSNVKPFPFSDWPVQSTDYTNNAVDQNPETE